VVLGITIERRDGRTYIRSTRNLTPEQIAQADEAYRFSAFDTAGRVSSEVVEDIQHQWTKYGPQRVSGLGWIAIITEEFGETVQAYLKQQPEEAIKEAKQTIACLMRFIVEIERENQGLAESEAARYVRPQ
jgi:hypothetical protein